MADSLAPVTKTLNGVPGRPARVGAWVYVFEAPHAVKVGITSRTPSARAAGIQATAGIPIRVVTAFGCETVEEAGRVESRAHRALDDHRIYGEWFTVSPEEAVAAVQEIIGLGARVWTYDGHGGETVHKAGRPATPLPRSLRELRLARRWTLADLSEASGILIPSLSQIERGRLVASRAEVEALSAALEVDLAWATILVEWKGHA